jgi:aromatic ring hydroxylase-like protein
MPDLDLVTAKGPLRVFTMLHKAQPVLLNLAEPGGFDIAPWADRVQLIEAGTLVRGTFRATERSLLPPLC